MQKGIFEGLNKNLVEAFKYKFKDIQVSKLGGDDKNYPLCSIAVIKSKTNNVTLDLLIVHPNDRYDRKEARKLHISRAVKGNHYFNYSTDQIITMEVIEDVQTLIDNLVSVRKYPIQIKVDVILENLITRIAQSKD